MPFALQFVFSIYVFLKPRSPAKKPPDAIFREVELTGVSGRLIWDTWKDFAKVMKSQYFDLERIIGARFGLKEFDAAVAKIRSGAPGKMIIYPGEVPAV